MTLSEKVQGRHQDRLALVYVRQSTLRQVDRRSTSRKASRPPSEESCPPSKRAIRGFSATGDRLGSGIFSSMPDCMVLQTPKDGSACSKLDRKTGTRRCRGALQPPQ
jgi:hypothetical protein